MRKNKTPRNIKNVNGSVGGALLSGTIVIKDRLKGSTSFKTLHSVNRQSAMLNNKTY